MHRSSELIGTIAAALAKAQMELTNPEKSLIWGDRLTLPRRTAHFSLCSAVQWSRYRAQEPGAARDCHGSDHEPLIGRRDLST